MKKVILVGCIAAIAVGIGSYHVGAHGGIKNEEWIAELVSNSFARRRQAEIQLAAKGTGAFNAVQAFARGSKDPEIRFICKRILVRIIEQKGDPLKFSSDLQLTPDQKTRIVPLIKGIIDHRDLGEAMRPELTDEQRKKLDSCSALKSPDGSCREPYCLIHGTHMEKQVDLRRRVDMYVEMLDDVNARSYAVEQLRSLGARAVPFVNRKLNTLTQLQGIVNEIQKGQPR